MLSLSGEAVAQQSAAAAAMLEEVVVTARRREESLEQIPMAVQAITADAMQAQGIYNIMQITDFAPNVVLQEDQRMNDTRFYVRGIGGGFSNPAQIFGVGMYVDGHYMSGSLGAFMSTVDIDRVEVLRGPQGTLFGKNTTGGALSLITAKPGPDFESYVTLRAASFGETGIRAMINTPVTDNLYFRGNYATETTDGFYFNKRTGEDMGGTDQESIGLALRWEPSDSWTIDAKLLASYDRDDNQGGQCVARPDAQLYGMLTRTADRDGNAFSDAAGPWFAGPNGVYDGGTGDDIRYTGPAPVGDGFDLDDWGSRNDHVPYRTANLVGGSDMRPDALYPGASAAWLNSCAEDFASGDVYQSYQDAIPHSYVDNEMFILDATWVSDGALGAFEDASVQIKYATRDTNYNYWQDRDFGPGIIDHIGNIPVKSSNAGVFRETDEFEVIFNGQIGDRVNLTTGIYYFDDLAGSGDQSCVNAWRAAFDPNDQVVPDQPGPDGILGNDDDIVTVGSINGLADDDVTCGGGGTGTFFHRLPNTWEGDQSGGLRRSFWNANLVGGESTAIYGHLDIDINDDWSIAVGLRSMEDDRTLVNVEPGGPGAVTNCDNGVPGDPGYLVPCTNPIFTMNRSTLINGGFVGDSAASYSETTGTVSLTRQLAPGDVIDSGIVYGTVSEGYLTGAFNDELNPYNIDFSRAGQALVQSLLAFNPEFVTNYEIGFKATMLGGNLRISADYFIMDYTDKQEQITLDNPEGLYGPDPNLSYAANAADVDVSGIEFELRAQPWDGGFLSIDAGILDFEYAEFQYTDFVSGELVTPELTQIQNRTPDWSLTATIEHAFQLGNGGTLTPQLGLYTQAAMEWWPGLAEGEKSPICHQESFNKWRARISYEPPQGNWQAALFGYNITDEEILFRCQENRHGVYTRFFERPAAWGLEFTMRFGENT
jgi:outer membrane receptor protein involved in Fe transport